MKNIRFSLLTLTLLFGFIIRLAAQQDFLSIEPAFHFGGNVTSAVFGDQFGYLAQGSYLTILDMSTQPFAQVGYLDIEDNPTDMLITNNHLITIGTGLHFFNLADPVSPVLVSTMELETGLLPQLDVQDNYIFAATHDKGIMIIDVSDFGSPVLTGFYLNGNNLSDVMASGDYLYALDNTNNQLLIIDKKNPSAPFLSGHCAINSRSSSLFIQDNLALVSVTSGANSGLKLFNITNKTNPTQVGFIGTKHTIGNTTHTDFPRKVVAQGSMAFVACSGKTSLYIFEVIDPAHPVELKYYIMYPDSEGVPCSLQSDGQYLFFSSSWSGKSVRKLDLSETYNPMEVNQYESPHSPTWIQSYEDRLYIADMGRFWIYGMEDINHPEMLVSFPAWSRFVQFLIKGEILYGIRNDTLFVLRLTNTDEPFLIRSIKHGFRIGELLEDGNLLFTRQALEPNRINVFSISTPEDPVKLSQFDLPGKGQGLTYASESKILYSGYFNNTTTKGMVLYDLSDPANPTLVRQIQSGVFPVSLVLVGDEIFLGGNADMIDNEQWKIERYDVAEPYNPVLVEQFTNEGEIWDLEFQDGFLFAGVPGNTIYGLSIAGLIQKLTGCPSPGTRQISISPPNMISYTGYGASVDGYGYLYQTNPESPVVGTYGMVIQKIEWPIPEPCCLSTVVRPEIAGTPGKPFDCKSTPSCVSSTCGGEQEVQATPGSEWVFMNWSGAADGTDPQTKATLNGKLGCPACADHIAYAHFTPWLKNTGGGSLWNCPFESEEEVVALTFTLQASEADNWLVEGIRVNISGDDELSQYIKKARLKWTAEEEKDHSGSGSISFTTSGLTIEAGKSQQFTLYLTFKPTTAIKCPAEAKKISIEVSDSDIQASAMVYSPGQALGTATGTITVGCVRNISKNLVYESISEAVEDAEDEQEIWVCPGDYEENVTVDKEKLKLKSVDGPTKTYVLAVQNDQPGLSLKANGITIEGFSIRNATKSYGIHVYGSTISESKLINNRLTNNKLGIYLQDALKTIVNQCSVFENKESGLYALNSLETNIANCSFYSNEHHGLFFEQCAENEQAHSFISQSSLRENKLNGIFLKNCKYPIIDNNISISRNDSAGVRIEDCEHIIVKNNPIVGENKEGVILVNSKSCEVIDNQIRENLETGIVVKNCQSSNETEGNTISGNILSGNRLAEKQKQGIAVLNSHYTTIGTSGKVNEIRSHSRFGILVQGGSKNMIMGDSIFLNDQYGILLDNTCGNNISGQNKIGPDNGIGIGIKNCNCEENDRNLIQHSRVMENKTMGIELNNSCGNHIGGIGKGNIISENRQNGIEIQACVCQDDRFNIIEGNTLTENTKNGIRLSGSDLNLLQKNIITANEEKGILLRQKSNSNKIRENQIDGKDIQQVGIQIDNCEDNQVDQNIVINHPVYGISIIDCSVSSYIINNNLEKNKTGIYLEKSSGFQIGKLEDLPGPNKLMSNQENGIYVKDCDGKNTSEIAANEFRKQPVGLFVEGSKAFLITDNSFTDKNVIGIKIQNCDSKPDQAQAIRLENNLITQCEAQGIFLENTQGVIIGGELITQSNQIIKNKGNGIHLENCKPPYGIPGYINRIMNNAIYEENHNGIYLTNCQFIDIRENNIHTNKRDGIHLSNSLWNTLHGNSIRENKGNGIMLKQSEQNKINANEMLRNEENGLFLTNSNYNEIPSPNSGKNILNENKDHGIRLDASQANILRDNEIFKNEKHGIVFNQSSFNKVHGPMNVMENVKDGIQLNDSHQNNFWNLIKASKTEIIYAIQIKSNGDQGLHLKRSHNNSFSCIKIWKHSTALLLENSNSNTFTMDVRILLNSIGGHGICSYSSTYGLCTYSNNIITTKQDGCSVVPAQYEGCHFLDSQETGFVLTKGADPTFRNCNFIGAGEWGIDNQNENGAIDARYNWWGDASGPGGTGPGNGVKLRGNILFEPWLTQPVNLQASFARDTLYVQNDRTDSLYYLVTNILNPGDSVFVMLQDSLDWPDFQQQYSVALADSVGFDSLFLFHYDPVIHPGETNKLVLHAESLNFPGQTARDSVYLVSYEPRLHKIILFPDSLELIPGESWTFNPILLDQHNQSIEAELVWWSDSQGMDASGTFTATEPGNWTVWVCDTENSDTAKVIILVGQLPGLTSIGVEPSWAELAVGDTLQFEVNGIDQYGDPFYFSPVWYADGGSIDSFGTYLATEEGIFNISASSLDWGVQGNAQVRVILVQTNESTDTDNAFVVRSVFPNPFRDELTFSLELQETSSLSITIYDLLGRKCHKTENIVYPSGKHEFKVDTRSLQHGVYFYQINRNGEQHSGKLIRY
ncbi:MAG TPA: hypothetical protein DCX89_08745 [Saprospirales bacterium]|nr:hypothetical protein [Saprospirales bacterium]HRQ28733.1 NosD domain-containing protein [Saprospiraceae bacterium]